MKLFQINHFFFKLKANFEPLQKGILFIMKKTFLTTMLAVTVFTTAFALTGCHTKKAAEASTQTKETSSKLKVTTSFYPMFDFASKVGGDKVEITNMTPAGTEPHDWEPSAKDIEQLEKSDVFIYNGADMEHWTDDVLASLDNKNITVVEASQGISLLKEGKNYDPHVWLNPLNAKKEMENIKEALIKADEKNKEYYEKNYKTYAKKFDTLDSEYSTTLSNVKNKNLIASHEAFGYLCEAYGLKQIGIEGLSPDSEPDAAKMKEIIHFAKKNNVKTIFFEELVSPKVSETIAKELGAEATVLDPIEGLSDEQQELGADYFSVMESNLQTLKKSLNK